MTSSLLSWLSLVVGACPTLGGRNATWETQNNLQSLAMSFLLVITMTSYPFCTTNCWSAVHSSSNPGTKLALLGFQIPPTLTPKSDYAFLFLTCVSATEVDPRSSNRWQKDITLFLQYNCLDCRHGTMTARKISWLMIYIWSRILYVKQCYSLHLCKVCFYFLAV